VGRNEAQADRRSWNSDRDNAHIGHDKALGRVMTALLRDDTELSSSAAITNRSAAGSRIPSWSDYPVTPPQTTGESPSAEPKSGLVARIKIVMLAT
jgi:hypothetical protein